MHTIRHLASLWALLLSTAAAGKDVGPTLLHARIDARCELRAQVRTDERAACWYLACDGKARRKVGCDLTAMHQIVSIDSAPDQGHLAVLSVGEGHPLLELVPVAPLLKTGEYVASCTINPFPGTLSLEGWQGTVFRFDTDIDLGIESIEQRVAQMVEGDYRWQLDPADCRPQRIDAQKALGP